MSKGFRQLVSQSAGAPLCDCWHPSGVKLICARSPGVSSQAPQPPANFCHPCGVNEARDTCMQRTAQPEGLIEISRGLRSLRRYPRTARPHEPHPGGVPHTAINQGLVQTKYFGSYSTPFFSRRRFNSSMKPTFLWCSSCPAMYFLITSRCVALTVNAAYPSCQWNKGS